MGWNCFKCRRAKITLFNWKYCLLISLKQISVHWRFVNASGCMRIFNSLFIFQSDCSHFFPCKKEGEIFFNFDTYIYIDQYLYTHLLLTISLRGLWLLPAISCYPAKYKCIAFVHFASNLIHKQDNLSKCQSHQSWTPAPCSGETSLGWATFEVSVFS